MAKTWRKYENLILLDPELGAEPTAELIERFRSIVRDNGGKMVKSDCWGIRNTAFEIKHKTKCYYVMLEYAGEGSVSIEFARQLNLLDVVVKFQSIKLAENLDPEEFANIEEEIKEEVVPVAAPAPAEGNAEAATEKVAAEKKTEEAATEEVAAKEKTEEAATEEVAAEEKTEEAATEEVAAEEKTEEAATEEVAAEEKTEEAAEEEAEEK